MIVNYCEVCGKYIGYHKLEDAICGKCVRDALSDEIDSDTLDETTTGGNK
jgi:hypothetical protein